MDLELRRRDARVVRRVYGREVGEDEPPQDLLLAPSNGAKLAYVKVPPNVSFSWKSLPSVTSYRLVVGRDANPLTKPVLDETTDLQHFTNNSLQVGTYFWGVYSNDNDARPLFLSPRRIGVQSRTAPEVKTDGIWDWRNAGGSGITVCNPACP